MSKIIRISLSEKRESLIKILSLEYFNYYRAKGVCYLIKELVTFLQRVIEKNTGVLLLANTERDDLITGFLVAFPFSDYQQLTGIYDFSGSDLLFSDNVFFIDSLIELSAGREINLPENLLTALEEILKSEKNFGKTISLVPENPKGYEESRHLSVLQKIGFKPEGEIFKEEVEFTRFGLRKVKKKYVLMGKKI